MARYLSSTDTIVAEVAERLNILSASEEDAIIRDINGCTLDVQLTYPNAPFLQDTTTVTVSAGTSEYTLPSDLEKLDTVLYEAGNTKVTYLPQEQFDAYLPQLNASGTPELYTVVDFNTIKFAPVPNGSYDITYRYKKQLGLVSSQSSTPPLPSKYLEMYATYGEFKGLRRQQRYAEADNVELRYENLKTRMIQDFNELVSENINIKSIREFGGGVRDYGDPINNIYGNRDL